MGLFGLLEDVVNVGVATVRTGVGVVADVATVGGELSDKKGDSLYTEDALENLEDALDKLISGG